MHHQIQYIHWWKFAVYYYIIQSVITEMFHIKVSYKDCRRTRNQAQLIKVTKIHEERTRLWRQIKNKSLRGNNVGKSTQTTETVNRKQDVIRIIKPNDNLLVNTTTSIKLYTESGQWATTEEMRQNMNGTEEANRRVKPSFRCRTFPWAAFRAGRLCTCAVWRRGRSFRCTVYSALEERCRAAVVRRGSWSSR